MAQTRFALLALTALAATACQTPRSPLEVRETIALDYRGTIGPATRIPGSPEGAAAETRELPNDGQASDGSVTVRATLLELPIEEVRGLLAASHVDAEGNAQGVRVARKQLNERIAAWNGEYPVLATPVLVVGYENCGSIKVTNRTAYVSRLTIKGSATQFMADPDVDFVEEGFELRVAPHRDGENAKLTVEWRTVDRVAPMPIGSVELQEGRSAGIQLPLVLDQRIRAEVLAQLPRKGEDDETILLGTTLTTTAGRSRLLCLEVDHRSPAAQPISQ